MADNSITFDKYLKKRADAFVKTHEASTRRRVQLSYTLVQYFRGNSLGWFGHDGKWWDPDPEASRMIRKTNIVGPVVRSNTSNFDSADIEIEVNPRTDYPKKQGGSNIAQAIVDYYNEQHWDSYTRQMMAKYAQLCFGYFLYTRPDRSAGSLKIKVPQLGESQIDTPGQYSCLCGASGTEEEAEQAGGCPHCGKPVSIIPGQSKSIPSITGYDEQNAGDICRTLAHPYEMIVDETAIGGRIDLANKIEWRTSMPKGELKRLFPKAQLKGVQDSKTDEDWALARKRDLEFNSGANDGFTRSGWDRGDSPDDPDDQKALYRRVWWTKETCDQYKATEDYKHEASGFEIKAGQALEQAMFRGKPVEEFKGLFFSLCGDEILDIDNEDHRDSWTAGGWEIDPTGYWYKGIEDLKDCQDMMNNWLSLYYETMMRNASPYRVYDPSMFQNEFSGQAGMNYPTNPGMGRERPIADYIFESRPAPLTGDFLGFGSVINSAKEDQSAVHPAVTGAQDTSNPTFKGKLLERNQATMQLQPAISIAGDVKKTWARQILNWAKAFWKPEHYKFIEGEFGQAEIEWFQQSNIETDFVISAKEGSGVPKTHLEKRQDVAEYAGLLLQDTNGVIPPALRAQMAGLYDVDLGDDPVAMSERQAELRADMIDQLCDSALQSGQGVMSDGTGLVQVDPQLVEMILSQPKATIKPDSDVHEAHIQFWVKRCAEVEDDDPNPIRDACYARRIQQHKEAMSMVAAGENTLRVQADKPAMEAQAAMEQSTQPNQGSQAEDQAKAQQMQQQQAQMEQDAAQQDQKDAIDVHKSMADAQDKADARAHEAEQADKQRAHDLQIAKMNAAAKAKPRLAAR